MNNLERIKNMNIDEMANKRKGNEMKIEFKDGYIELNQDGTETIVGECAHTYYFTLVKNLREAGLSVEEIFKEIKSILLEKLRKEQQCNEKHTH